MFLIRSRLIGLSSDLTKELNDFSDECDAVDSHIHRLKEAYELSVSMKSKIAASEIKTEDVLLEELCKPEDEA